MSATSTFFFSLGLLVICCVCVASCGGASDHAPTGDAGTTFDGGMKPTSSCLSAVCAGSIEDCSPGERCNTALTPPRCQAIYCGANGTACHDDQNDADNLCSSTFCSPLGSCDVVPPTCGHVGDSGNALGVGKYCVSNSDCASLPQGICTDSYCTMPCTAIGTVANCGASAYCAYISSGTYCYPYCKSR